MIAPSTKIPVQTNLPERYIPDPQAVTPGGRCVLDRNRSMKLSTICSSWSHDS